MSVKREKAMLGIFALGLIAVWAAGCAIQIFPEPKAREADRVKPEIENPDVNPKSLRFTGGTVIISASVTDNVKVQSVNAVITKPDGTTETKPMSLITEPAYQTTYMAPYNVNSESQTYQVQIIASDTSNNINTASAPPFTVQAPEAPPEEPATEFEKR